jgi:hypothetical protein
MGLPVVEITKQLTYPGTHEYLREYKKTAKYETIYKLVESIINE